MGVRKCAVMSCGLTHGKMFNFPTPRDRDRFEKWLSASGNVALLSVPEHKIIHRTICFRHFENKYFSTKRLVKSGVPTIMLPEPIDGSQYKYTVTTEISLPLPSDCEDVESSISE